MYSKETKDIISKLLSCLKKEQQKGTPLISLQDPIERAHVYTGISKPSLRRWLQEDDSLVKIVQKRGPKEKLDSFDVDIIVTSVQKMFAAREVMTLRRFLKKSTTSCHGTLLF